MTGAAAAATEVLVGAAPRVPTPRMTLRRWVLDVTLAAGLTAYAVAASAGGVGEYPTPGLGAALCMGVAGAALAFRRAAPTPAFVVSLGGMSVCALAYGSFQAGSSLLIAIVAVYSAVAHRVTVPLVATMVALFALAEVLGGGRWGGPGSAIFVLLIGGLAGGGGWLARRLRELSAANEALRTLVEREAAATTAAAVDDERARIARELHDILSHSLAVVALQAAAAEHSWDAEPGRAREAVRATRSTALEAIDQLKALLAVVRDDPAGRDPLPTVDDLPQLAAATTAAGFRVSYGVSGTPRPLSAQVQASVFRVAQEGIANALKHSGGHGCAIRLDYRPDEVVVQVDDDGGAGGPGIGSRFGLLGIRERAEVFGGQMSAGPRSSGGWQLRVAFPA